MCESVLIVWIMFLWCVCCAVVLLCCCVVMVGKGVTSGDLVFR